MTDSGASSASECRHPECADLRFTRLMLNLPAACHVAQDALVREQARLNREWVAIPDSGHGVDCMCDDCQEAPEPPCRTVTGTPGGCEVCGWARCAHLGNLPSSGEQEAQR